jgi:hypothetical protein
MFGIAYMLLDMPYVLVTPRRVHRLACEMKAPQIIFDLRRVADVFQNYRLDQADYLDFDIAEPSESGIDSRGFVANVQNPFQRSLAYGFLKQSGMGYLNKTLARDQVFIQGPDQNNADRVNHD